MIYDVRADEIHRFDSLTAEVFDELLEGPRQLTDLVGAMGERLAVRADPELERLVAEILRILRTKQIAAPLG